MHQVPTHEPRDTVRDELHMQLLAQNAFVVTMIGAVAFVVACLSVLSH